MTTPIEDEVFQLVKDSLRVAGTDDDALIKFNIQAAAANIKGRVGSNDAFYIDNIVYKQAVVQQAINFYLNRSSTTDVNLYETEFQFKQLILDLKTSYLVWQKNNPTVEVSDGTTA